MYNAPIFIIDDDKEELDMVQEIWQELNFPNSFELFSSTDALFDRLRTSDINPFIIISDVNLPKIDGFTLRQKLAEDDTLRYKSIPFVFWSTTASNEQIKKAYDTCGHGFFLKGKNYAEIKDSLNRIMIYWMSSKVPVLPASISHGNRKI